MGLVKDKLETGCVMLLVVLFGAGSWVSISGVWTEVPVLIANGIPEQYHINSYMTVAINLGNCGLILFLVVNHIAPKRFYRPEIPANYCLTAMSMVGTFLLMFCWDRYTVWSVDNKLHSTAFLVLILCISFVDITSNLTFVGFMSILKPKYLNWYWVGQGLSAVVPSFLVLIQNSGETYSCVANFSFVNETVINNHTFYQNCTSWEQGGPVTLFGPVSFFGCLFVMTVLCHISFVGLNTLPCARREYEPTHDDRHLHHDPCGGLAQIFQQQSQAYEGQLLNISPVDGTYNSLDASPEDDNAREGSPLRTLSRLQYTFLYSLLFIDFFLMYGIFASMQSYSASAYGHKTFTLAVPLREMIKVVAFFLFLVKPVYSFTLTVVTFFLGCIPGLYCLAVGLMSPTPPLQGLEIGKVIIVFAWLCEGLFMNYCRVAIVWIIRNGPNSRKHLIWSGLVSQLGVLIGTVIMFPLINVYHVFEAYKENPCPDSPTCVMV